MSMDIDLVINAGKHDESVVAYIGNMTNNLQPMWRKAITETSNLDMNLCDFDGWLANDTISILDTALNHMKENKPVYIPLNPSNGWGSYGVAVEYLESFLDACTNHPDCTIRIDC